MTRFSPQILGHLSGPAENGSAPGRGQVAAVDVLGDFKPVIYAVGAD